jgi:hypothetical protein
LTVFDDLPDFSGGGLSLLFEILDHPLMVYPIVAFILIIQSDTFFLKNDSRWIRRQLLCRLVLFEYDVVVESVQNRFSVNI